MRSYFFLPFSLSFLFTFSLSLAFVAALSRAEIISLDDLGLGLILGGIGRLGHTEIVVVVRLGVCHASRPPFSVFSIIMDVIFYRRNPKSDNYKYVIFICNCILYIALVFFTGLNVAFVGALAMAPLYILYSNLRFTIVAAIYIELVNILSALKCYIEGKMPDGTPFDLAAVLMQVSCVFVFCVAICFVTAVIIKHSNDYNYYVFIFFEIVSY